MITQGLMTFIISHFQASRNLRNIRYSSSIIENYRFNIIEPGNTCFEYLFVETLPRRWEKSAATGSVQQ